MSPLGDEAVNNVYNVEAYPNPAHDKLNIEFDSDKEAKFLLSLVDLSGRVLTVNEVTAVYGNNIYELDLSTFSEGLYVLNVEGPEGSKQLRIVVE